jgi:hypothetical protein
MMLAAGLTPATSAVRRIATHLMVQLASLLHAKPKPQQQQQQQQPLATKRLWRVLIRSVQGQQLLQAGLSLLMTVVKTQRLHKDSELRNYWPQSMAGTLHMQYMVYVMLDLEACTQFLQLQPQQECDKALRAEALAAVLPHPQLVAALLCLAKEYYRQLDTDLKVLAKAVGSEPTWPEQHSAAAAAAGGAAAAATSSGGAARTDPLKAAGTSADRRTPKYNFRPLGYDRQLAALMDTLVDFVATAAAAAAPAAAQGTGLWPLESSWKGLLGLPSYGVLVKECRSSVLQLYPAVDTLDAQLEQWRVWEHQQREQQQQGLQASDCAEDTPHDRIISPAEACSCLASRIYHLLCTLAPSRYTCNGLSCSSLRTVSESFALVRGKACVCGCCVAQAPAGKTSCVEYR